MFNIFSQVTFIGEDAVDAGGVKKVMLLFQELLDLQFGMFVESPESKLLWFTPENNQIPENVWVFAFCRILKFWGFLLWFTPENNQIAEMYNFIEKIFLQVTNYDRVRMLVGLAIYNSAIVELPFPLTLSRSFCFIQPRWKTWKHWVQPKQGIFSLFFVFVFDRFWVFATHFWSVSGLWKHFCLFLGLGETLFFVFSLRETFLVTFRSLESILDYEDDDLKERFELTFEIMELIEPANPWKIAVSGCVKHGLPGYPKLNLSELNAECSSAPSLDSTPPPSDPIASFSKFLNFFHVLYDLIFFIGRWHWPRILLPVDSSFF